MIISFLLNSDSKYIYIFPLMINVVLRISHKKYYWAYFDYKDLFLRWVIMGHNSIIWGTYGLFFPN
jgi:hypothetical protein